MQALPTTSLVPQHRCQMIQLPGAALTVVLQQLDQCCLAHVAVACSTLREAAAAAITKVTVRCRTQEKLESFCRWLDWHGTSLANLQECSVTSHCRYWQCCIRDLPCCNLRQLHLEGVQVQLGRSDAHPGVLHHCSGLTSLSLRGCQERERAGEAAMVAAAVAIAALPQLQRLELGQGQDRWLFAELSSTAVLQQLTSLSIDCGQARPQQADLVAGLSKLPKLVGLQHLKLRLPFGGEVPGGLPSQLVKLTCLDVHYVEDGRTAAQYQHLSSLSALQQLALGVSPGVGAGGLSCFSGIQHLSQLTRLQLDGSPSKFSTRNIQGWTQLAALQSLTLAWCRVQPQALARCTQLQALVDRWVECTRHATHTMLLDAVSQLSMLTLLHFEMPQSVEEPFPAAAFTALTSSTNLCSLEAGSEKNFMPLHEVVVFRQGMLYPSLRTIAMKVSWLFMPVSEQQLQQLCTCCPAVETLTLAACKDPSPTAWHPLLQLSALTRLVVHGVGAAVAAVTDTAAQLTGLRQLELMGLPQLTHPALVQLTALTALEKLYLDASGGGCKTLQNKVHFGGPPDVWMQLQQHLSDEPCQ